MLSRRRSPVSSGSGRSSTPTRRRSPRALAWAAWSVLLVSIGWLGRMVTPRRLARFWERLRIEGLLLRVGRPMEPDDEAELIRDLGSALGKQIRDVRHGTHISIFLGLLGLGLAALGYAVDKAFYGG